MKYNDCNVKVIFIKCKFFDRTVTYHLASEDKLNSVITNFVILSVFQNIGLLWIIENNKHYKFEIYLEDTHCTGKCSWYNTTIGTKLNGQCFGDYLKTGQKDRYYLMCSIDMYEKKHETIPISASIGGGRPMPSVSS